MKPENVRTTIDEYLCDGWRVEYLDVRSLSTEPYVIYSPGGSAYSPHELTGSECSYCTDDDEYCWHDEDLLAQERTAKHLCDLIEKQRRLEFCRWAFKPDHE